MLPSEEMQLVSDHYDALGRALADTLNHRDIQGGGWTHEPGWNVHGSVLLRHPANLGVSLVRMNTHRKGDAGRRLTIDGIYPSCWGGARVTPITVGMDRPALRIADEIVRRLLPDYLETLAEALKETRIAEENRRARVVMNRRLEGVLPGLSAAGSPRHPEPSRSRSYWYGGQYSTGPTPIAASGNVTLRADATHMDLKLTDVPAELALKILEMLRPSPVLEGVVTGRAIEPAHAALPRAERLIPGELVDRTRSTDAEALPAGP
ncbi:MULTISPECIES: hypothetical protein [Streptomyces]|uniref:hypothetical protein n=1 Tax=Streptomyces TaxID=1883 RepID=UPI000E69A483|nr:MULTISPECIES: hypothetical protein [Streptomyces]MDX3066257.1 hypothetical protein [Streptomyces sp. ND04-05B]MDX3519632.1 hypothetical protein [Streptomyces scabiei]